MEGLGSGLSPLSASHFSCFLSLGEDAGAESSCGFHVVVRTVKAAVCGLGVWPGSWTPVGFFVSLLHPLLR